MCSGGTGAYPGSWGGDVRRALTEVEHRIVDVRADPGRGQKVGRACCVAPPHRVTERVELVLLRIGQCASLRVAPAARSSVQFVWPAQAGSSAPAPVASSIITARPA
jgi:hypothetical protein